MSTPVPSRYIKELSRELGFSFCGISRAERLDDEEDRLADWLSRGLHGKMKYMENHFEKRLDPRLLVPGAKTVVSLLYNYFPPAELSQQSPYKISRYAYGEDYHLVLREKLSTMMESLRKHYGPIEGRGFSDSAPVMERAWAARSGLGWIGKHSLLINKGHGSYFFLSELILDLAIEPDGPVRDYCGTCTACQDACPTDALATPYQVDATKCISYLTIELKEAIPESFKGKMEGWVFGCDICQEVCPWNRFSQSHDEVRFLPSKELQEMDKQDWEQLTEETFKKIFSHSPVQRTGFSGLQRNIRMADTSK